MFSMPNSLRMGAALALTALCASVVAQPRQSPGETSVSVGVTGLNQFNTRIVDGGSFNWQDASANVNVTKQFTSDFPQV